MTIQQTDALGQKPKSLTERVIYAILFEVLGILISSPIAALVMKTGVTEMGVLTVTLAILALLWNVIFNYIFDRLLERRGLRKGTLMRVLHAGCFEFGLFACSIPLTMWYLDVGFVEAISLDIGLTGFYLVYTYLFSLIYDWLRGKLWGKIDNDTSV